jgi:hypothetical protein
MDAKMPNAGAKARKLSQKRLFAEPAKQQDAPPRRVSRRWLNLENKKAPEFLRLRSQFVGVGVRHALFPGGTRFGALAFAGGVLPDATLRGMRMSRSHGGTVLTVTGRDL